ncbi:IQ motif and ankyrin repeat domain-containing protein 1-like [Amphiura filiformis]|uniref:IQ motif and ankyrin repeat domain-containing protein 1-like n=1 Tax=Amphiura filiformis TaxID=82378 RepID=UPI003B21E89B
MPPKKSAPKAVSKPGKSTASTKKKTAEKKSTPSSSTSKVTEVTKEIGELNVKDINKVCEVNFKDINHVLLKDEGGPIQTDGRWPYVIDPSPHSMVATFLRYQNVNYINGLDSIQMQAEPLRRALLAAIRYGKPLVLDMMDTDVFTTCTDKFNEIHTGLMDDIMSKEIIKNEKYTCLIRGTDGDEYNENRFLDEYKNFKFIILSKIEPEKTLKEKTCVIRVVMEN